MHLLIAQKLIKYYCGLRRIIVILSSIASSWNNKSSTFQFYPRNYESEMEKFQTMKNQLKSVNHISVKDLVEELE